MKGIMIGEETGKPIGCIELSNTSQVETESKGKVAESDSDLDDDVGVAFQQAQKMLNISAKNNAKS